MQTHTKNPSGRRLGFRRRKTVRRCFGRDLSTRRRADELDLVRTNTGHSLGVAAVAAHPSGIIAASSSLDSFVRVFDVDTNATIAVM
ncbi:hypothetical protein HID58_057343 [Brassica napus]|uniref:Uncharacterized protein n=1 Tax=Brassica napus TaxID=3708 RepID=A0ABQ8AQU7_BRANA|nr:hypothetical protein HID58_057343 [Brassica napus]